MRGLRYAARMSWFRRLRQITLAVLLVGSAGATVLSTRAVMENPALTPVIDRTGAEIAATVDRMMVSAATPARIQARIDERLAETPRNWVALQALADLAAEQGVPLPAGYAAAWDRDSGLLAATGDCLSCMWDIATCTLSAAMICKVPLLMTPVEDLRGVVKAGADYATGDPVDRLDLGLSIVGLGATAAILASGGTTASVKAGTTTIRLARGMGRLSPALTTRLTFALTDGIRWADLPAARSADDLTALIRTDALAPVAQVATDLGRIAARIGPNDALHLLPLVDDAADARRLSRAADALGPQTLGRAEMLGKTRLLRATVRFSDVALGLIAGLVAMLVSLGMIVGQIAQTLLLRSLRRF